MRSCLLIVALALLLTGSLFALAKTAPAEALGAYQEHVRLAPESCLGCGCPGCSCISCG